MTDCTSINDLKPDIIIKIKHNEIMEEDMWRVGIIKEIMDMKHEKLTSPVGWENLELEDILKFACVS